MREYKVDLSGTRKISGVYSTRIVGINSSSVSRVFFLHLGPHLNLSTRDIPQYYGKCGLYYLAPCAPDIHKDFVKYAYGKKKFIAFNPGTVYLEQGDEHDLFNILERVDLLFLNQNEALRYAAVRSVDKAGKTFLKAGPNIVVITRGTSGCLVFQKRQKVVSLPSFSNQNVVSTIGAGDAFAAGFLSDFIHSKDVSSAGVRGNAFGTFCTTLLEPRIANPDTEKLASFMNTHGPKNK